MNLNKILTVKRALIFVTACSVALAAECLWLGAKLSEARDGDPAILKQMISQAARARSDFLHTLTPRGPMTATNNPSPVAPYLVRPAATMKGTNQ